MGTFVVTAGHSNTDPGAVANGRKEAEIACDMRSMIASKLRARGATVETADVQAVTPWLDWAFETAVAELA